MSLLYWSDFWGSLHYLNFKDYNIVDEQLYSGNHRGFAFTHMRIRVSKGKPRNNRKVFSESPEFLKSFKDVK